MKKSNIFAVVMSLFVLASCASSSDVVDGGLFQKRKYNKGWHINSKTKVKNTGDVKIEQEEVLFAKSNIKETVKTDKSISASELNELPVANDIVVSEDTKLKSNKVLKEKSNSFETIIPFVKRTSREEGSSRVQKFIGTSDLTDTSDDVELIIMVILAIILPPLAVGIYEGITTRFWITLILWLIAWGIGGALLGFGIAGLCSLIAVVYALLIVLGVI